jgi:hypothetical protein
MFEGLISGTGDVLGGYLLKIISIPMVIIFSPIVLLITLIILMKKSPHLPS